MYTYKKRVSFYENDGMSVVWHGNYIKWFEDARVGYFLAAGLDLRTLLEKGIVFPILKVQAEYRKSAHFGETIAVKTYLRRLDRASAYFEYEVCNDETGELLVTGSTLNAFESAKTGRIVRIPEELIAPLRSFAKEDQRHE